jgi:hypothetical protein
VLSVAPTERGTAPGNRTPLPRFRRPLRIRYALLAECPMTVPTGLPRLKRTVHHLNAYEAGYDIRVIICLLIMIIPFSFGRQPGD